MRNTSGFGWDDIEKMILVDSEDVWENYVKTYPNARKMRNKPFPMFDDWLFLFGRDKANDNLAEGPGESMAAIEREEATEQNFYSPVMDTGIDIGIDMSFFMPEDHNTPQPTTPSPSIAPFVAPPPSTAPSVAPPPSSTRVGKKRARENDDISKGLTKMSSTFRDAFQDINKIIADIAQRVGYQQDLSNTRKQVHVALKSLPLTMHDRLKATSLIVKNPQHVDLFFSLCEDNEMLVWVNMLLEGFI
ncbi:hypothetical protein Dimus_005153 [Dionaea muscipula]